MKSLRLKRNVSNIIISIISLRESQMSINPNCEYCGRNVFTTESQVYILEDGVMNPATQTYPLRYHISENTTVCADCATIQDLRKIETGCHNGLSMVADSNGNPLEVTNDVMSLFYTVTSANQGTRPNTWRLRFRVNGKEWHGVSYGNRVVARVSVKQQVPGEPGER